MMDTPFPRWTPEEYRRRPRDYDPGLAETICQRVANGETLSDICQDRDLPLPGTFLLWVRNDSLLRAEYLAAQEIQTEVFLEEMPLCASMSDPREARNQMDARRLLVEKRQPGRYGPRAAPPQQEENEVAGSHAQDAADVRRRLEAMADRVRREQEVAATTAPAASPP